MEPGYRGGTIIRDLNPLAIAKIKIRRNIQDEPASSETEELPETLRRIGTYLLQMLRIEYQQKKVQIAGMDIHDAVQELKIQVRQYAKQAYPFDRPYKESDGPRKWWERLNANRSNDAQPLAVGANHCASVDITDFLSVSCGRTILNHAELDE